MITTLEGDAVLKLCIEIKMYLDLTHYDGKSYAPGSLMSFLLDKDLSVDLSDRVGNGALKAYQETGTKDGDLKKYLQLCAQYVNGSPEKPHSVATKGAGEAQGGRFKGWHLLVLLIGVAVVGWLLLAR